jgi:hypothetical protein
MLAHGGFNRKTAELNGEFSTAIFGYQALQHVTAASARTGGWVKT